MLLIALLGVRLLVVRAQQDVIFGNTLVPKPLPPPPPQVVPAANTSMEATNSRSPIPSPPMPGKLYVYDWPGASASWYGNNVFQWSLATHGYGSMIDESKGIFQTSQYALYRIFYNRALTDPARTLNPKSANLFFIPYDFGTDAAFHYNIGIKPRNCPNAAEVTRALRESPDFTDGKNHILIISINFAMNSFYGPDCVKFLAEVCQHCIKLSIDDYSFLFGEGEKHEKAKSTMEGLRTGRGVNWHAVPFPSDVHWSSKMKHPYPWEGGNNRDIIVSYIGSSISYTPPAKKLRSALVKQCQSHPDVCVWLHYGSDKQEEKRDFSKLNRKNGTNPHDIMSRSVFCLTPMGDVPTRKGLFDSILLGCIPVTFNVLTATVMYTWHWPEDLWREVLVEVDRLQIYHRKLDVITLLTDMYRDKRDLIESKQRLIRENAFRLQYSYIEDIFDKMADDAYDHMMRQLYDSVSGRTSGARNGSVPECGFLC